jgi:addiction module HigA family antidote
MLRMLDPITPGEILLEEFMKPLDLSQNRLARELDVPPVRIHGIIHGKRAITPDTASRLAPLLRSVR